MTLTETLEPRLEDRPHTTPFSEEPRLTYLPFFGSLPWVEVLGRDERV